MKRITLTVTPDGQVTIKTTGYQGPSCKEATRFLETALGRELADRNTAEYHARPTSTNTNGTSQDQDA